MQLYVPDPSLVLHLPLRYMDGDSYMSKDAYGHLCTRYGTGAPPAAHWTAQGWKFDHVDDYIDVGSNTSLNFTSENFTIEAGFKKAANATIDILFGRSVAGTSGYDFYVRGDAPLDTSNLLRFNTRQFGAIQLTDSAEGTIIADTPYLVIAVRDGSSVKLYINGPETTYRAQGAHIDPDSCAANAYIGSGIGGPPSYLFNGLIGFVSIYNRAFTPQEAMAHYIAARSMYG